LEKTIKKGALVKITAGKNPIVEEILGWHSTNNDFSAMLFKEEPYGIYLGLWKKIETMVGDVYWHQVLIEKTIYLFTADQIEFPKEAK